MSIDEVFIDATHVKAANNRGSQQVWSWASSKIVSKERVNEINIDRKITVEKFEDDDIPPKATITTYTTDP